MWAASLLGGFCKNLLVGSWVAPTPGCTTNFPRNRPSHAGAGAAYEEHEEHEQVIGTHKVRFWTGFHTIFWLRSASLFTSFERVPRNVFRKKTINVTNPTRKGTRRNTLSVLVTCRVCPTVKSSHRAALLSILRYSCTCTVDTTAVPVPVVTTCGCTY